MFKKSIKKSLKEPIKKIFNWKNSLILMASIAILLSGMVFLFNDVGAVVYEKYFRGNVLFGQNVYMKDHVTGNAAAKHELQGLVKVKLVSLSTMTNGTTETVKYIDSTPTGEWAEVDAGTAVLLTKDTTYYREGAESLKIAFTAAAVTGDGADGTIAGDDLTSNESIGFWIYSTVGLAAADFYIELDDNDAAIDYTVDFPAIVGNKWVWVELDISSCDGGGNDCNVVSGVKILMSATGAVNLEAVDIYLDAMYKWDAADEETLDANILTDGVLSVMSVTAAEGQPNTIDSLVEYTGYFTHYQTGDDAVVSISDNSAESGIALIAYQPD